MSYRENSGYKFHRPRIVAWGEHRDKDADFVAHAANVIGGTHICLRYPNQPRVLVQYQLPKEKERNES